ncbi:radical SAM protein [Thalassoglobus sp. JC818]|uniref:radical SAM protein n=1 Tax=Thalassoglobus sp. JC818 TaxID=3232136 RepID=UPI003459A3A0
MANPRSVRQHRSHPRQYEQNRFVYPVLSRRSKGISIGVNLNPDKVCNFDCIYCQVDRRSESVTQFVEFEQLFDELAGMLEFVSSGEIFTDPRFADVPAEFQRLNDIAFSGDGEPTTYRNFDEIIERAAQLKASLGLDAVKMVLITNASMFHRPVVQRGLKLLDENQGEIWAKLDAGTSEYFQLVDRTKIRFQQVLDNILEASRVRPLVIQSLFMRVHGEPPTSEEIEAYIDRLENVLESGGQLSLIQVYTVARQPAESFVAPLLDEEVDTIAERVRTRTGLAVESYYS